MRCFKGRLFFSVVGTVNVPLTILKKQKRAENGAFMFSVRLSLLKDTSYWCQSKCNMWYFKTGIKPVFSQLCVVISNLLIESSEVKLLKSALLCSHNYSEVRTTSWCSHSQLFQQQIASVFLEQPN